MQHITITAFLFAVVIPHITEFTSKSYLFYLPQILALMAWYEGKKSWRGKKNEIICRDKGVEMYDFVIIFNWPCLNLILEGRIQCR